MTTLRVAMKDMAFKRLRRVKEASGKTWAEFLEEVGDDAYELMKERL